MYDYYDEESYYEPTPADEIFIKYLNEMKNALTKSAKYQIEKIKLENKELKDQNKYLQEKVNEIGQKEKDLEIQKSNLERKVRNERLSKLMKDFEVVMYRPDRTSVKLPKCDKCNENRRIKFTSPLGKTMDESCTCDVSKPVYNVEEYICTEFRINSNNDSMLMWYKMKQSDDYDYASYRSGGSDLVKSIYQDGMNFKDLDRCDTYFKSKDDCQKYCDWLNENSEENIKKLKNTYSKN